jgi:hypothetical protein
VRATQGDADLIDEAVPLVQQPLACGRPLYLHALFDAGAGKRGAGVRALWNLAAAQHPRLDATLRACHYPHRLHRWKHPLPCLLVVPHWLAAGVPWPDGVEALRVEACDQAGDRISRAPAYSMGGRLVVGPVGQSKGEGGG